VGNFAERGTEATEYDFAPSGGEEKLQTEAIDALVAHHKWRMPVQELPDRWPSLRIDAEGQRSRPEADAPRREAERLEQIGFPEPTGDRMTGSEFMRDVLGVSSGDPREKGLTGAAREAAILEQIEKGNVPEFLRNPKTVVITDKNGNRAELKVMPDYLAIGTDEDFVRVPVTPLLAKSIADKYGMALPTKKVVDGIYEQSDVKLSAVGLVRTKADQSHMQGNGFYNKHDQIIDRQLAGQSQDALVAGHKKDIIISRYAETHPSRLDFYGFFDANGKAIQGAHGGPHEDTYVDYSHGARFISQDIIVNGRHMSYDDVLRDPQLAGLLSDDGAFDPDRVYRS
jgi:hypothetical protein